MLKFIERPKLPGITSKKTWFSLKRISCLQVISELIWMKQTLIWFKLEMDCLTSRIFLQNVCSYKYRFCSKVRASSRLVSQVHMIAGRNTKKKYLMCQIPIKMLTQHAIQDSSLHNLKIYSPKGCLKPSQSLKMNCICM